MAKTSIRQSLIESYDDVWLLAHRVHGDALILRTAAVTHRLHYIYNKKQAKIKIIYVLHHFHNIAFVCFFTLYLVKWRI